MSANDKSIEQSIRRYLIAGVATAVFFIGGIGGLAATTKLSGAVITGGRMVVDSSVKKIQHPSGGVVGQINVREGTSVKEGDVLVKLDETLTRANLGVVSKSIDELQARVARLEAERDGAETVEFPAALLEREDDPVVKRMIAGERSLFEFRRSAREGQKSQLRERIAQLGEEVSGLELQKSAKSKEIEIMKEELASVRQLWQKKLVSLERMTALERDAVRLDGELGQLTAAIAQSKGRASEIELQIIYIGQEMRSEVAGQLREAQGKLSELAERRVAAEDQLKRIEIRSPQDGVVHQLAVHTVGGVISPGEVLMQIVPVSDDLTIEVQVAPQDIDQLRPGQEAAVRLSAFNMTTTPELDGVLRNVSADLTIEQRTGAAYYTAFVILPKEQVARLKGLTLTPGMPAEVFFRTTDRTILSYLVKPLSDQIERAFREE
ncbi:HlyD family type I secretion periplasmic adaptor subunit [Mesorhizobium sp. L-8-10]|uniref:HlyD family type I secretion periplasmic adaptor subunit n=1 Tax=unclassified Mesorhizobium TaxID=325217 RepID=UPI001928877F|nr:MULTISPECIES: HlyD family type I secretion periplasmic adaptor subunit [unclassified Mesorhizobium]BCH20754.1 HlyD family type I secretion periplasmic adaptor subunit [Mesorhizobium sp. L-8-3]BCH28598.1 HlyD family type I secretion periplasmic adaptor subunit [Mesorhizobium sp. L-8-10]